MCVLILGFQGIPAGQPTPHPPTSMATANGGGSLTAAAHAQQQYNAAAAAAAAAAGQPSIAGYPSHALGGGTGTIAALQGAQPLVHSTNPAIEAALTQAYNGIAQYTGINSVGSMHGLPATSFHLVSRVVSGLAVTYTYLNVYL